MEWSENSLCFLLDPWIMSNKGYSRMFRYPFLRAHFYLTSEFERDDIREDLKLSKDTTSGTDRVSYWNSFFERKCRKQRRRHFMTTVLNKMD